MKANGIFLVLVMFLAMPMTAHAENTGNSSSEVRIINQVNTGGTSTTSTTTTEGSTNVEIHQTGEGTSSVTVNGKEWKLEGPGDISVQEGSVGAQTPTPTAPTGGSPTPTSSPTPADGEQDTQGFVEALKESLANFKESIQNIFSTFFGE